MRLRTSSICGTVANSMPRYVVDEDLAAVVGLGEAVGRRIEFRRRLVGLHLQRIEIGMQVPAHAIGADHHDGVDGIARRLQHIDRRWGAGAPSASAFLPSALPVLTVDVGKAPVAIEGGDEVAIGLPAASRDAARIGPSAVLGDIGRGVFEAPEIARPGRSRC